MRVLIDNEYARLEEDDRILFVRRKAERYPSVDTFRETMSRLFATVDDDADAFVGLVVDSRAAMGRNDDDFEQAASMLQEQALSRLPRLVILMKTKVGILQARRLTGDDARVLITDDEGEARRFLHPPTAGAA